MNAAVAEAKALALAADVRDIVSDSQQTNAALLVMEDRALRHVRESRLAEARDSVHAAT